MKSRNIVISSIRRKKLEKGFLLTHSTAKPDKPLYSSFYEEGDTANFVFVLKGKINIKTASRTGWKEVTEGNAYYFSTNNSEIFRKIDKDIASETLILKICKHRLEDILSDTGCKLLAADEGSGSVTISPYTFVVGKNLTQLQHRGNTGRICMLAAATDLLASSFLISSVGNPPSKSTESIVIELASYIRKNIGQEQSLADLSRMAGMSHTRLNRLFREIFGKSVFGFIRKEQIIQAEHYLKNTDMSITEIAYCTGFCSPSHFCARFRQKKGISPKDFRSTAPL